MLAELIFSLMIFWWIPSISCTWGPAIYRWTVTSPLLLSSGWSPAQWAEVMRIHPCLASGHRGAFSLSVAECDGSWVFHSCPGNGGCALLCLFAVSLSLLMAAG